MTPTTPSPSGAGGVRPPRMLVVWCPDWPVTAARIDAATPGAVIAEGRVAACSAAARAHGVRRGQKLRDAQRHCPSLVVADRDPDAEGRLFERVISVLTEITPKVEALRPGMCATPVSGPARYYGGEAAYRARVAEAVTAAGFPCGVGIADGIFAAALAARSPSPEIPPPETPPPEAPTDSAPSASPAGGSPSPGGPGPGAPGPGGRPVSAGGPVSSPSQSSLPSAGSGAPAPDEPWGSRPGVPVVDASPSAATRPGPFPEGAAVEGLAPGGPLPDAATPERPATGEATPDAASPEPMGAEAAPTDAGAADTADPVGVDRAGVGAGAGAVDVAGPGGPVGVIVPVGEGRGFLGRVSTRVLDRGEMVGVLGRLGIWTLGELAALPAARVAERFGADGAVVHRLASGLDPRPLAPRPPQEDLSRTHEFEPPADAGDRVVFAAKTLAEELHAGLAARGLICVRLAVELTWDDGHVLTRLWRHDGALSALAVAERVRWQMSGAQRELHDPARPEPEEPGVGAPGGIRLLRLAPDALAPDTGEQQALWGGTSVSGRVGRAAARVQALLGHHAIVRPVLVGGRGPAERIARVPVGDLTPEPAGDGPWPGRVPDPAPSVVYPRPHPVEVLGADDATVTVDVRCNVSAPPARLRTPDGRTIREVTAWTGPWPMTEYWWDPGRAHRRARFQVTTGDGHAYLLLLENGRWYVEAAYA